LSNGTKTLVIALTAALAGALIGAVVAYSIMREQVFDTKEDVATAQAQLNRMSADLDKQSELLAVSIEKCQIAAAKLKDQQSNTSGSSSTSGEDASASGDGAIATNKAVSKAAFVKKAFVDPENGRMNLTLDYVDFLTGKAAADAAAAAGDESPPPNDYYVSNVNSKLRTLKVDESASFVVSGGDPSDTTTYDAGEFIDFITSDPADAKYAIYVFTIKGDKITGGREKWVP
jgi:hypothetical protein